MLGRILIAVVLRLSGVPLFSWLGLAGLLMIVGLTTAAATSGGSTTSVVFGVALAVAGLSIGVLSLRVAAWIDRSGIRVRNRLRSYEARWDDVIEVRSRVTGTPMTRGMGWGQLEFSKRNGVKIPVAASTGIKPPVLQRLLDVMRDVSAGPHLKVDTSSFPTLGWPSLDRNQRPRD